MYNNELQFDASRSATPTCQMNNEADQCWIRPDDYSAALRAGCESAGNAADHGHGQATTTVMNADHELYMRQRCALQAQYLGNRMRLKQICINTAIVCMHRMFLIHSIDKFNNLPFIGASLFLASKIEEVPISLEYCAQTILAMNSNGHPPPNAKTPQCQAAMQEIVFCENAIINTLAFNFNIIQPNYLVLSYCNKLNLPKELTKLAYTLGTYILILSNMCVRYKPSLLACVCINLAYKCMKEPQGDAEEGQINDDNSDSSSDVLDSCKWMNQFDNAIVPEQLEKLTNEYRNSIQRTPIDLKKEKSRQTFPDPSQINPLISNLLFSKSQLQPWSLFESSKNDLKHSVSEMTPTKRGLFDDKLNSSTCESEIPPKITKFELPHYMHFSKQIKEYIDIAKSTYSISTKGDGIKHEQSIDPLVH